MHEFDYSAPTTLDDAVALMARFGNTIKPMAGGTDLIDQMRLGTHLPSMLLDIKKIPELNVMRYDASGLTLGAAVPCYQVYGNAAIATDYSALADSCHIIGGIQIQTRASMGGNLCNSGPAADSSPSLIALGATCVIVGPGGRREVPAEKFCTGPGRNVLEEKELLVELRFPPRPPSSGSHYRRFIPRNEMDIAVVGVAASVVLDAERKHFVSARIALGAVAPTPLLAEQAGALLAGQPIDDANILRAADAAKAIISPISDMRGTREYRTHLTGVLTQRVLMAAVTRARGEALNWKTGH